jgi:hypothetical protein
MKIQDKMYLSGSKWTKTTSFLLPILELDSVTLDLAGFVNAFLGDNTPGIDKNEDCIYLLFAPTDTHRKFFDKLKEHEDYLTSYMTLKGLYMLVFTFPENLIKSVYNRFKRGEYSKIDRKYVTKYFNRKLYKGRDEYGSPRWELSKNWLILNADGIIREQIEQDLDVSLKPGAEVFSKPNEKEYYYEGSPTRAVE